MKRQIEEDIERILLTKEEISAKIIELGEQLSRDYEGKSLLMISVLKGSIVFMADLMRAISIHAEIDFMAVSSYGAGTKTTGVVRILKDIDVDLAGRDILIVEDILDSGMTLSYLKTLLEGRSPASIRVATLLDKPSRRKVDMQPDYCCFTVPDEFLIGYGLDYAEKYRNLPYIGVLKPQAYQGGEA